MSLVAQVSLVPMDVAAPDSDAADAQPQQLVELPPGVCLCEVCGMQCAKRVRVCFSSNMGTGRESGNPQW